LFLLWKPVISLEEAATKISKVLLNDSKLKTKVRRLYDIANVLCVLKIIKKTLLHTGKPAFQWVGRPGIEEFSMDIESDALSFEHKSSVKNNASSDNIDAVTVPINTQACVGNNDEFCTSTIPLSSNLKISCDTLPLGLNGQSLDLLDGIVRILRKRLNEQMLNPPLVAHTNFTTQNSIPNNQGFP
jgi:hypothetical protein